MSAGIRYDYDDVRKKVKLMWLAFLLLESYMTLVEQKAKLIPSPKEEEAVFKF